MHIGKALSLYTNHFLSIVFIAIVIVFPLQVVSFTYSYQSTTLFGLKLSSFIISLFIQLFFFNLMQVPFIQLAYQLYNKGKVDFKEIFGRFIMLLVPVSIMTVYYLICVLIGLPLLIIPAVFMLVLLYIFPYTQVIEKKQGWELFKQTYNIGRSGFVDILILLFIFICLNVIIWTIMSQGLFWFDPDMNFTYYLLFRFIINVLILPFFTIVITINYDEWKRDSERTSEIRRFGRL